LGAEKVRRGVVDKTVRVSIPEYEMGLIRQHARAAEIGGASNIRGLDDRLENLAQDQLVGQVCHYAAMRYLTGSVDGYRAAREAANRNPYRGDGGRDVVGLPIDVKGSLIRGERPAGNHRLLVRPRERRPKWIYVLALAESLDPPVVQLMGWTEDSDLPVVDGDGRFRGAHSLWADELRPMCQLRVAVQAALERRRGGRGGGQESPIVRAPSGAAERDSSNRLNFDAGP
jgi:hypothetical protein